MVTVKFATDLVRTVTWMDRSGVEGVLAKEDENPVVLYYLDAKAVGSLIGFYAHHIKAGGGSPDMHLYSELKRLCEAAETLNMSMSA